MDDIFARLLRIDLLSQHLPNGQLFNKEAMMMNKKELMGLMWKSQRNCWRSVGVLNLMDIQQCVQYTSGLFYKFRINDIFILHNKGCWKYAWATPFSIVTPLPAELSRSTSPTPEASTSATPPSGVCWRSSHCLYCDTGWPTWISNIRGAVAETQMNTWL